MKAVIVVWEIRIDHNSINNNKPTHTHTPFSFLWCVCVCVCTCVCCGEVGDVIASHDVHV